MEEKKTIKPNTGSRHKFVGRINVDYMPMFKETYYLLSASILKRGAIESPKKILLVNIGFMGDTIHSLPSIKQLIQQYSSAQVDMMVSPVSLSLVQRINGLHKAIAISHISSRVIDQAVSLDVDDDYDFIFIMRTSKSAHISLKNMKYAKVKTSLSSFMKYGFFWSFGRQKYDVRQWSEFHYDMLGQKKKSFISDYNNMFSFIDSDYSLINSINILKSNRKKIVLHTGSGWVFKQWAFENWVNLLRKLHMNYPDVDYIFVGGNSDEKETFLRLEDALSKDSIVIHSVIGVASTRDLFLLMQRCDLFIGIDSGPRHLADIADIPGVCLLGPGPKHFMPMNGKTVVIDKSNCYCNNLFCYRKKSCIEKIDVDEVFEKVKFLMEKYVLTV